MLNVASHHLKDAAVIGPLIETVQLVTRHGKVGALCSWLAGDSPPLWFRVCAWGWVGVVGGYFTRITAYSPK